MKKILLPIANGFEEIEAISVIDICRRAEIEVTIASIESEEIVGAHNITIKADINIVDAKADDYDMIVLPGGLPNAFTLAQNTSVQTLLKEFKQKDSHIAAICAAPYALHTANVLNKNYTCYPSFEEKITLDGYNKDKSVVVDQKVITSQGPATAMQFALEIVKTLKGEETYKEIKTQLLA